MSYRRLAARTYHGKTYLHDLAAGRKPPTREVARRIDDALDAGGELAAMVQPGPGLIDRPESVGEHPRRGEPVHRPRPSPRHARPRR